MLNSTLYDDVNNCFEVMKNPDNVKESLLVLSQMNVTSEVLEETNASMLIMNYFGHATCGDLARRLAMDWLRIRSPKMPEVLLKRKAKMGDSITHKKTRISEDEENISSVFSITEDNEEDEEFNPFTAKDNISIPTAEVAKRACLAPSTSSKSRYVCPKKMVGETRIEEISQRIGKKAKSSSPPLAPHASSTSPSSKKASEEARIAEISQRIAQNKAEKDAKHRKTVVISDHDYTAKPRRSRMCK